MILVVLEAVTDKPVDLILRRPGDIIRHLALPILVGRTIYGEDETEKEAGKAFEQRGGIMASF
jgi:hypothetical protein